ncbi:MAG TPA: NlpC/P60 family protein [Micromonosporaceae bacterium]
MTAPDLTRRHGAAPARRRWLPLLAAALGLLAIISATVVVLLRDRHRDEPVPYRFERLADPARTVMRNPAGEVVAVFTDGARTAVLSGAERVLSEPATTTATVTTRAVVRLTPRPWHAHDEDKTWFRAWYAEAMESPDPDVIAIALQYLHGAAQQRDRDGVRFAGSASFGPVRQGQVSEFSDFTDYLGIDWTFPDRTVRKPNRDRYGALDCSGFVRMVYGYRSGYPMEFMTPTGTALPRRAVMMAEHGPGIVVVPDSAARAAHMDRLQPGDLVFFDVDPSDGTKVDHVGIYLGIDSSGRRRFVSSRKANDGPTLGDTGGVSLLDGTGLYARGFRSARRL